LDDFRDLLTENKNLGHINSKSATSGPKFEKVKNLLKSDKRYAHLDPMQEERDKEMVAFIEKVLEKGKGKSSKD